MQEKKGRRKMMKFDVWKTVVSVVVFSVVLGGMPAAMAAAAAANNRPSALPVEAKIAPETSRRAPAYRLGETVQLEQLKPGQWLQLRAKVIDVDATNGTVLCEVSWQAEANEPAQRIIIEKAAGQEKLTVKSPVAAQ